MKKSLGRWRSAGILPAFDEPKGIAGWKPALRQRPRDFFISLLVS
jgi:hypothetical protein